MKARGWVLVCALVCLSWAAAAAGDLRITPAEANKLSKSQGVVVIDVRRSGHWNSSLTKIKGAVRQEPSHVRAWAKQYDPDQTMVLYCA